MGDGSVTRASTVSPRMRQLASYEVPPGQDGSVIPRQGEGGFLETPDWSDLAGSFAARPRGIRVDGGGGRAREATLASLPFRPYRWRDPSRGPLPIRSAGR